MLLSRKQYSCIYLSFDFSMIPSCGAAAPPTSQYTGSVSVSRTQRQTSRATTTLYREISAVSLVETGNGHNIFSFCHAETEDTNPQATPVWLTTQRSKRNATSALVSWRSAEIWRSWRSAEIWRSWRSAEIWRQERCTGCVPLTPPSEALSMDSKHYRGRPRRGQVHNA